MTITVVTLTVVGMAIAGQALPSSPSLPPLPIESFPPAARTAIGAAQREAAARPDDGAAAGRLAMVLHAWEQWDTADVVYRRAQALAPETFAWPYLRALVARRTQRWADAVSLFERALAIRPASASASASAPASTSAGVPAPAGAAPEADAAARRAARVNLAEALFESGDLARSRELYAALVREPPVEPIAEYGLGRIAAAERRWTDAIAHLRRACLLFNEFGAAHYALALAARQLDQLDEAQRELTLHRLYGPRWPALDDPTLAAVAVLKDDGRAHLERGIALNAGQRVDEAIAEHEIALQRDPALAQAHANLVLLYGRQGNLAKAAAHRDAAIALKSNRDEAHYNYAIGLALQRRDAEALDALRAAVAVNPYHGRAYALMGAIFERAQRWDEAVAAYRQEVASQPASRLGRFNVARMLIAQQHYDAAIAALDALLTPDDPSDAEVPRYVFALATAHLRAGRRDEGLRYAADARRRALALGQTPLAAAIDKDLAAIGARLP